MSITIPPVFLNTIRYFDPTQGVRSSARLAALGFVMLHADKIMGFGAYLLAQTITPTHDANVSVAMPLDSSDNTLWHAYQFISITLFISGTMSTMVHLVNPTSQRSEKPKDNNTDLESQPKITPHHHE